MPGKCDAKMHEQMALTGDGSAGLSGAVVRQEGFFLCKKGVSLPGRMIMTLPFCVCVWRDREMR